MAEVNRFSWKIAGIAGDGILNAGMMLAKSAIKGGLWTYASAEYPSLIRGGHNHLDIRISDRELFSHTAYINMLVALNQESVDKHAKKLTEGGGIIYDGEKMNINHESIGRSDVHLFPIPLLKIATECGGKIMRNVVAMGATIALTGFDLDLFNGVLKDNFGKKGGGVLEPNIKAAKAGYDYVKANFGDTFPYKLKNVGSGGKLFMSGNECLTAGAIKAGCKFYAAYPMTPASSLLHVMAGFEKDYKIVVKHTEDELAAMNMAIGANFAGVRAMTGTSGGGFALMSEAFGLAGQTETPLVVVNAMRPGPATGMATHSGQGDLRFVLHAAPDDFPRIVVAPGDQEECFYIGFEAFNIAEKFQLPVVIITDKYLGESYKSMEKFDASHLKVDRGMLAKEAQLQEKGPNGFFTRYKDTDSGVSLRSVPGQKGGEHVASSYEHDEEGYEREEEENKMKMAAKRFKKFEEATKYIKQPEIIGAENADLTVIGWGSTKGPILEAMKLAHEDGLKINYLQIVYVSPFPKDFVERVLRGAKNTVIVENNQTSQMSGVIKEHTGLDINHKILRYDGRPFNPEDLFIQFKEIIIKNEISASYLNGQNGTMVESNIKRSGRDGN